ncbi:MAG: hypothetical protein QM783_12405 [Phycisphaerales bacterium]
MAKTQKDAMMKLLNRSSDVINEEMTVLENWKNESSSSGRAARCAMKRVKINDGARTKMDSLLDKAQNTPEDKVVRAPDAHHEALVEPNERDVEQRSKLDVNSMTDNTFDINLDNSEFNANDSVADGVAIFEDCTAENPLSLFAAAAKPLKPKPKAKKKGDA